MVNENVDDVSINEENTVVINEKFIREHSSNPEVIKFIQSKFNDGLRRAAAMELIKKLLWEQLPLHITDILGKKHIRFKQYNKTWFDENDNIKLEKHKELHKNLLWFISVIDKDIYLYDKTKDFSFDIKTINGVQYFVLTKHSIFNKVEALFCDEGGEAAFYYDYDKPDMYPSVLENHDRLQRCNIQILGSTGMKFDYPVEFQYVCPKCGYEFSRKPYEVESTRNKLLCEGVWNYRSPDGEPKSKICNTPLYPHEKKGIVKTAYYYDIGYDDENGKKRIAHAYSFIDFNPGFYDCILFKTKKMSEKTEVYHIVNVREIETKKFILPEKLKGENYVFTLQKEIDIYIKQQTGLSVWGLFPVKCSLILQKAFDINANLLLGNIQVVGDTATGKSTILKYYGYLLNTYHHLTTNGLSISVPGLRGTRTTLTVFNKDIKIITPGHLGSYKIIHIDEAGENPELVKNLKTFLADTNYSYDKAGTDGTFRKRTAQVNLSENLSFNHVGQYRGIIRKYYRGMKDTTQIGTHEQVEWDETWDLFLPLYKYTDNPYLHKAIKDKRLEYKQKQQFWLDGYDYALHERFPFYFYLVNDKECPQLKKTVDKNVESGYIQENFALMKALNTKDLEKFYKTLPTFEGKINMFPQVSKILESYGLHPDGRVLTIYNTIAKMSAILNQRTEIEDEDLYLIKWLIENTNCKIDVADTAQYNIEGAPNLEEAKQKEQEIEVLTTTKEETFGMPEGEFD